MDAVDAALLNAVGAFFLAEAGGVAGQGQRQLIAVKHLVDKPADHRMFRSADQIEVLALDLVHHCVHLREGHDPLHNIAVDHEGWDHIGEALADHKVARIGEHGLMQPGDIAEQVVEPVARNPACGVEVDTVEAFHDFDMVGDRIVGGCAVAEALDFNVAGIIGPNRHRRVHHLRNRVHDIPDFGLELRFASFQLLEAVGLGRDLRLDGFGFGRLRGILLGLAHQHTDLLAELVAVGAQAVGFADCGAILRIKRDDFIYKGKLLVLEFLFDVFLDKVGIFPHKTNIEHDNLLRARAREN